MKKNVSNFEVGLFIISCLVFSCLFFSCATLQQDIFYSMEENDKAYQSVNDYEKKFIQIDSSLACGKNVAESEISSLITQLENMRNLTHLEPSIRARFCALEGCLYIYLGKVSNAQELYKISKALQSSDSYVILLGVKLEKNDEMRLEKIDTILSRDENNALCHLEKAKILYRTENFASSVSAIDKALVLFSENAQNEYVEVYSNLKNEIWKKYEAGGRDVLTDNELTPLSSVDLALKNSSVLDFLTGGRKVKTENVYKNLEKQFFFSAANDFQDENKTSLQFENAKTLDRRLCARFLWNLYVENADKLDEKNKYSQVFALHPNVKSPIPDVSTEDADFDAIMGTVENEIMNLSDGRNFYPNQAVTEREFVEFLLHLSN